MIKLLRQNNSQSNEASIDIVLNFHKLPSCVFRGEENVRPLTHFMKKYSSYISSIGVGGTRPFFTLDFSNWIFFDMSTVFRMDFSTLSPTINQKSKIKILNSVSLFSQLIQSAESNMKNKYRNQNPGGFLKPDFLQKIHF